MSRGFELLNLNAGGNGTSSKNSFYSELVHYSLKKKKKEDTATLIEVQEHSYSPFAPSTNTHTHTQP